MGTSGAMSTSNGYVKYNITVSTNWQSVGENYSSVNVKVNFWRTNSGYQTYGTGTVYCKINGTTYSASVSTSQKITSSGITLFNRDVAVPHNSDGSKYLDASAWISLNTPLSSSEQSYGEWLTTIPRASSISSIVGNTFGSSITVSINRASDSFTHIVDYMRPDGNRFRIGENVGTSCTFTPALEDSNYVTNSSQGTARIYVDTYQNGTFIGWTSKDFTIYVPSSVVPTINSVNLTENTSGIASKFGCFVQGKSTIKGEISASGAYGSSINKYQSSVNSQSFNSSTFTTNELLNSGNQSVSTVVTDSRGRTASRNTSFSVASYNSPTITSFTAIRANSSGQLDDKGSYVLCTINASISTVNNKNDKSFILKWKANDETEVQSVNLTSSSEYEVNTTYLASEIDIDKEYTFTLEVKDYFSTTVQNISVPTAFTLMDFNASGRALAIGKVSTQDNTFDIALKTIFENSAEFHSLTNFESDANFNSTTTINGERVIFEGGLWTPSIRSINGTNPTYIVQYRYGRYKRINNLCYITFFGKWSISNAGTDYACITGLPYVSSNEMVGQALSLNQIYGAINRNPTRTGIIPDSSSRIHLLGENGAFSCQWQTGDFGSGLADFI